MDERIKIFLFLGNILILLIGLAFFCWSIKPSDRIQENNIIKSDEPSFSKEKNCSFLFDLLHSNFIFDYPKVINYKESGDLSITIKKSTDPSTNDFEKKVLSPCKLSLEVWIDVKNMIIEPGNKSFETYLSAETQKFYFLISPLMDQPEKGTIWIYTTINNENNLPKERLPLFAIPFNVQIKSLNGTSPEIIRNYSLILIGFAFLSLILFIKMK